MAKYVKVESTKYVKVESAKDVQYIINLLESKGWLPELLDIEYQFNLWGRGKDTILEFDMEEKDGYYLESEEYGQLKGVEILTIKEFEESIK